MHILLTNDDGIEAKGIQTLWEELSAYAKVSVVAPDRERSAMSQAITVRNPIHVDTYNVKSSNISAWQVAGTPTDCVKIALEALLDEMPDYVVSGINNGPNLGSDVLYSGTVSAAIEGALHNIPSIAVSLDAWCGKDYRPAARFIGKLIFAMQKYQLPPNTLLNVNVPDLAEDSIDGYVITKLGVRKYENVFEKRQDPRGKTYYWMGGTIADSENDEDSDVAVVKKGKISITPIHFDLTNYELIKNLQQWNL